LPEEFVDEILFAFEQLHSARNEFSSATVIYVESCAIDQKLVPGISRFNVKAWVQAVFPQLPKADWCVFSKHVGKQYVLNLCNVTQTAGKLTLQNKTVPATLNMQRSPFSSSATSISSVSPDVDEGVVLAYGELDK
jgi:hypothetical protein